METEEIDMDALEKEFDTICENKTLDDVAVEKAETEIAEEKEIVEEPAEEVIEKEVAEEVVEEEVVEEVIDPAVARIAELEEAKRAELAEDAAIAEELDSIVDFSDMIENDKLFDLDNIPDIEVGEGDKKTNLKELFTEFPAVMEAVNIMVGSSVKKVKSEPTQSLAKDVAQLKFKDEMEQIGEGTYETVMSPDFAKWVGDQSEGMQMLATSADRSDSKLVLDAYSKSTGEPVKKAEPVVSETKKEEPKKAKMEKLLGNNIKSKTASKESTKDSDSMTLGDLEAEWDLINKVKS